MKFQNQKGPPGRSMLRRTLIGVAALLLVIGAVVGTMLVQQNSQQRELAGTTATTTARHATATTLAQHQQATTIAIPTATATALAAYPSYMPGSGTFVFYDPLQEEQVWKNFIDDDDNSSCQFQHDGLHIQTTEKAYYFVCSEKKIYANFAFEVQMTMIKGDCGGLGLRYDAKHGSSYTLFICHDGTVLLKWNGSLQIKDQKILACSNAATVFKTDYGQMNTIAAFVKGSIITVYVNQTQVLTVNDATFSQGVLALLVCEGTNSTEALYREAKLWTITA